LLTSAVFLSFHAQVHADEARGLITIGMQRVFEDVKPAFKAASKHKLNVEYASTSDIAKRVRDGELVDFVITSRAGVNALTEIGKVTTGNHFMLAGSPIAAAVPEGHPKPDISTVDALKHTLLAARAISYTDPASGGPSGMHLSKVLEQLGIADQVRAKTKFPPSGGPVGDILANGGADIGIQQMAELSLFKGVDLIGPLPSELQLVTEYALAIPANSVHPETGKAFVEFMRSPQGVAVLRARGLDPR
jgi:molybdate transport system substrate-binding protein